MQNPIFGSKPCVFDIQGLKRRKNKHFKLFFPAAERLADLMGVGTDRAGANKTSNISLPVKEQGRGERSYQHLDALFGPFKGVNMLKI